MTENFRPTNLRAQAREALKGQWGNAAVAALVVVLMAWACGLIAGLGGKPVGEMISGLLQIFVVAPLEIGLMFLFLDVARGDKVDNDKIWEAFRSYGRYLWGIIVVAFFTLLWLLLLIVPGIIKSYAYSMTLFIMREHPLRDVSDAMDESEEMMRGHKMDLFLLQLSFIGWFLLCIPTLFIGLFWLVPYVYTSVGRFYDTLKAERGKNEE